MRAVFEAVEVEWRSRLIFIETTKILNELKKTRWKTKFGLDNLENDFLTSMTSVRDGPFLFVRTNEVKHIRYLLDSWKDFQRKIKRQEEKDWTIHVWENFKSKVGTLCYQNLRSTKVHHSMPTHNADDIFFEVETGKKNLATGSM